MLSNVLKCTGRTLAIKASQRVRPWSSQKWSHVIIPDLEDNPLWSRSNESLSSILIYGLSPEKLHEKLERYWKKPSWRQWAEYLFTSIKQQQEAWSYYQQCLAFRETLRINPSKQNLSVAIPFTPSQTIMEKLASWLSTIDLQFASYISKHSTHWIGINFESKLINHEKQRKKKFKAKLNKELKEFKERDRIQIKNEINQAYNEVEKVMRKYLQWCHSNIYLSPNKSQITVVERSIVSIPDTSTMPHIDHQLSALNPSFMISINRQESGLCTSDPLSWINARRKEIECLNKQDEHGTKQAQYLLNKNLLVFTNFIQPQIQCYIDTIKDTLLGKIKYNEAVEFTQHLQSGLIKCYRLGSLLFHPDRNQDLINNNSTLAQSWKEAFQNYNQHWNNISNELESGQANLKQYIEQYSQLDRQNNELIDYHKQYIEVLEKMILQLQNFQHRMDTLVEELLETYAQNRKEREEDIIEIQECRKDMEEDRREIKKLREGTEQDRMEINEIEAQIKGLFIIIPNAISFIEPSSEKKVTNARSDEPYQVNQATHSLPSMSNKN